MAYYMELGINTMNYMFYGNNDSFVVFLTISELPLRTKYFQPDLERVGANMDEKEP